MKYIIRVSYDGSKYYGLQKLNGKNTIQGELETVLTKLNEKFVKVSSASRTDRGVHAYNQMCEFELDKALTPYRLRYYINRSTSTYLHVKECYVCNNKDFHVRYSSKGKIYLYKISLGEYDPLNSDYVFNYNKTIDINKMREVSKVFIGSYDYRVFVTDTKDKCISTIEYINIKQNGSILEIEIKGETFYTHMVRNIVGALIKVGENKASIEDIKEMVLNQKRVIEYKTAPACGLYLVEVVY